MVNKTINISLDLKRVTAQALDIPRLVEGDTGNIFVITLTDDGDPVDLSACRVLAVFSKVSDSTTTEQDTEDGYIDLYTYGIELVGSPNNGDTITVTSDGIEATVVTDVTGGVVTIDADTWLEHVEEPGTYTITYVTADSAWKLFDHSVVISGTDHNIITIDLKNSSYGAGKNNCELQIYSGLDLDTLVTTAQFNFDGRKGISNEDTIKRDSSYPLLVSLISQVRSLIGHVGDMTRAEYDPNEDVRLAGGIPAYVADELDFDTLTEAVAVDDDDTYRIKNNGSWFKITWATIKSAIGTLISTAIGADRPIHKSTSLSSLPTTVSVTGLTANHRVTDMKITGATTSFVLGWTTAAGEITFSLSSGTFSACTVDYNLEITQ